VADQLWFMTRIREEEQSIHFIDSECNEAPNDKRYLYSCCLIRLHCIQ